MCNNSGFVGASRLELNNLAFARRQLFNDRARVCLVNVDRGFFDRLVARAVNIAINHAWARN